MKRLVLAALCSLSLSACAQSANEQAAAKAPASEAASAPAKEAAYAAGTPEARVREALRALNPQIQVDGIAQAPIPGFREVIAGGQVVYVSDDGRYLFQGNLLDIQARKDLGEAAMAKVRKRILQGIPMEDRIVYAPAGQPRHTVVVLTDVECGYCRRFHQDIAKYNELGIRVEYLAFPRAGIGSPDYHEMVSVWCSDDRRKALTDAKAGRKVAKKTCARSPVDQQHLAGNRMGLTGTPMIITEDGTQVGGYLAPEPLRARLDQLKAGTAAGG
ncbi:DsbC family protein [Thermomonas brevis]